MASIHHYLLLIDVVKAGSVRTFACVNMLVRMARPVNREQNNPLRGRVAVRSKISFSWSLISWVSLLQHLKRHLWKWQGRTYPLDFHTLCPVHVVAFTVRGIIVGVCWGGRLKVLGILCQLQFFGFLPWLVAELYQSHGHSQAKPSNQNIEDSCHVAQA